MSTFVRIRDVLIALAAFSSGSRAMAADSAGNVAKGKTVFTRCAMCHAMEPGKNRLGPSLANVVGQKAAQVPGFKFSPAMAASNVIWTPENLDKFLANPRTFIPGNRMTFAGLPNREERTNVIAYLARRVEK